MIEWLEELVFLLCRLSTFIIDTCSDCVDWWDAGCPIAWPALHVPTWRPQINISVDRRTFGAFIFVIAASSTVAQMTWPHAHLLETPSLAKRLLRSSPGTETGTILDSTTDVVARCAKQLGYLMPDSCSPEYSDRVVYPYRLGNWEPGSHCVTMVTEWVTHSACPAASGCGQMERRDETSSWLGLQWKYTCVPKGPRVAERPWTGTWNPAYFEVHVPRDNPDYDPEAPFFRVRINILPGPWAVCIYDDEDRRHPVGAVRTYCDVQYKGGVYKGNSGWCVEYYTNKPSCALDLSRSLYAQFRIPVRVSTLADNTRFERCLQRISSNLPPVPDWEPFGKRFYFANNITWNEYLTKATKCYSPEHMVVNPVTQWLSRIIGAVVDGLATLLTEVTLPLLRSLGPFVWHLLEPLLDEVVMMLDFTIGIRPLLAGGATYLVCTIKWGTEWVTGAALGACVAIALRTYLG